MTITIAGESLPILWVFNIDSLSIFMASIFIFIGFLTSVFSMRYMERDSGLLEYHILLILNIAGSVGVVFAGDFFSFFIFWQIMCITSYVLVTFRRGDWEPAEAGFKYLIMSESGSAMVLFAMSLLYGMTGTLNFAYIGASLALASNKLWPVFALALIVTGFGIKAAIVPMHSWLPDAYPAAPSSMCVILAGVVTKTGIFAIIRSLFLLFTPNVYSWQIPLVILAILSMSVGNLMALLQKDVKRLLGFSSIAHMGYIMFGVSIATYYGLTGSIFHILNHALMKSLLFLCIGAFIYSVKSRNLDDLAGIGKRMKITGVMLTLGSLALAGIPPLNGFQSKLTILLAGIEMGNSNAIWYILSAIMFLNMFFSLGYYLRLIQIFMLNEPTIISRKAKEAPILMLLPIGVLAFLCVAIGIYPEPFISFSSTAARSILDVCQHMTT